MPKAKHEQLDDGWTRVGGRSSSVVIGASGFPNLDKDATLTKLLSDFEKKMNVWKHSSCCRAVYKMLERECPEEGWPFNKAICLASGSFSRDNLENRKRSMSQFVTFIDIVNHVSEECVSPIRMLAQDPSYTDLDKQLLAHFEIEVLDLSLEDMILKRDLYPAKTHLGPQTMLFEFFMDTAADHLRAIVEANLQFYLGSSLQIWIDKRRPDPTELKNGSKSRTYSQTDTEKCVASQLRPENSLSDLAEKHIKDRRALHFPRFEEDPLSFEGLVFHWRNDDEDQDDANEH